MRCCHQKEGRREGGIGYRQPTQIYLNWHNNFGPVTVYASARGHSDPLVCLLETKSVPGKVHFKCLWSVKDTPGQPDVGDSAENVLQTLLCLVLTIQAQTEILH